MIYSNNSTEPDNGAEFGTDHGVEKEDYPAKQNVKAQERKAELYAMQLRRGPDINKIQPLEKLASIGGLNQLEYVLPLSQYSSEFIRKLARNTAVKIILRALKKNEDNQSLYFEKKVRRAAHLPGQ